MKFMRIPYYADQVMLLSKGARVSGNSWKDYENIYPEDEYMKEMGDGARVWVVFNDESERIDAELVDGWTGTLDTLFIFAGLFSAVIATFVALSTQSLQQDYTAVTASLLTELVNIQRATTIGGDMSSIPRSVLTYDPNFTSSSRDVWLNSLWLASLALTLATALMAGFIKQWLHYYLADITGATPKVRACTRQLRYTGLIRWGVPPIIESLPVLMNTSLFLFFVGLILFTQNLSNAAVITWFLTGLTAISFIIYIGSSFIPVWEPQCPYKTSLSKVYNGFINLIWLLVKRATGEGEGQESKSWIVRVLSHGSSLRTAESQVVKDLDLTLQRDVITEMTLNSTNPSASSIALQSLSALHALWTHELTPRLPDSLVGKLQDLFSGCFRHDPLYEWGYHVSSPLPVAERYSRAMLLLPDHILHLHDDWDRIASFSPPQNLHTAALLACTVRQGSWLVGLQKPIIQCILDLPHIEVSKVLPWHHHQFINATGPAAISPNLYSAEEQEHLFLALNKRLSPKKALTLQEDMLIRCLYTCHSEIGVDGLLPKEDALIKKLDSEASVRKRSRATLLRFIMLLPFIADCVFSLGSEERDHLFLFLLGMDLKAGRDEMYLLWDEGVFTLSKNEPAFAPCLASLSRLLSQLASSWEDMHRWNSDVLLRLKVIMSFYNVIQFHGNCDKGVTWAMFHWHLAISLGGRHCTRHIDPVNRTRLEDELLETLFPGPTPNPFAPDPKDCLVNSLQTCCTFIASRQFVGLPLTVTEHLLKRFNYLLGASCEPAVLGHLDTLFNHFLQQDPFGLNPVYPTTQADWQQTLTSFINFAHRQISCSNHWREMLSHWRVLVKKKLLEASMDGEANVAGDDASNAYSNSDITKANSTGLPADPWDLRDALWIFKVDEMIEPWDLRDVLWIFEEQEICFGGPSLNLEKVLRCLDRALDLHENSADLCDVTRLFKDAPDDLFPPPNHSASKVSVNEDVDFGLLVMDRSRLKLERVE